MTHVLILLDYGDGSLYSYEFNTKTCQSYTFEDADTPQTEELERIITDQGHSIDNVEWMIVTDPNNNGIRINNIKLD